MKYILFDMDGVLINTEPLHFKVWKKLGVKYGIDMDYDTYKACIGSTRNTLFQIIKDAYGVDLFDEPTVGETFAKIKADFIAEEGLPRIDGAEDTVRYLYDKGYKMAVASSSGQSYIENQMKEIGIYDCFQVLCSGEDVPNPKPAPDVFLKACKMLGAQPEECIVVEDSMNGSIAAKAAGMYCYGIANPDSGNQDLSNADVVIPTIKDLKKYL